MAKTAFLDGPVITQKDLDPFQADVGVLDSSIMSVRASKEMKSLFGISAHAVGKRTTTSMSEVSGYLENRFGWLKRAAATPENDKDLARVTDAMLEGLFENPNSGYGRRYLNALIAWVRNPIMRKEFGRNKPSTIRSKGFDFPMVNTLTFFKSISARFAKGK